MRKGALFVILQFICMAFLLSETSIFPYLWYSIFQWMGVFLGVWAIIEANKSNFSIFPEVKKGAVLVNSGPFKVIRHPMYSSILLFFIGTLIHTFNFFNLALYFVLLVTLLVKLNYEESLLMEEFDNYKKYRENTWRLVPYLY